MPTFTPSWFEIPRNSDGRRGALQSITTGSDGNLWFIIQDLSIIARLTPADGVITRFLLDPRMGVSPRCITVGPDRNLWFTEGFTNKIGYIALMTLGSDVLTPCGRFNPAEMVQIFEHSEGLSGVPMPVPSSGYSDPTCGLLCITTGPDGNLWFTEGNTHKIGRITIDGVITEFSQGLSGRPQGITKGPGNDNTLWFTEPNKIGCITTSGVITEYSQGLSGDSDLSAITAGPDGNLWATDRFVQEDVDGRIWRITPRGEFTQFPSIMVGVQMPCNITVGRDNHLWVAGKSRTAGFGGVIARIDPTTGTSTTLNLEGLDSTRLRFDLTSITTGPDGNIWFTDNWGGMVGSTYCNQRIGRIVLT